MLITGGYSDPVALGAAGYTFDPFGNLTAITGAKARNTPTAAATNRLTSGTYDAAGNLTDWNGAVYQYDRFNQMLRMTSGSQDWAYVYTAGDERIWSYDLAEQEPSRWTLRDLSGQVLREYLNDNGAWTVETDYIHRDGQLLAAETRLGRRHFHLDHLGTPRLITNGVGYKTAYHVYYPFGEEATAFNQDVERMKFTGHERDLANPAGTGDDLDYMHARHFLLLHRQLRLWTGCFAGLQSLFASGLTHSKLTVNDGPAKSIALDDVAGASPPLRRVEQP